MRDKQGLPFQIRKKPPLLFILLVAVSLLFTLNLGKLSPAFSQQAQPVQTQLNPSISAATLNEQGRRYLEQGQAEAALNSWKQAAAAYQQAGNQEGVMGSQMNQAQAMQVLGQYLQAKQLLTQVKENLVKQPNSLLKATVLRSFGEVLRVTGELEASQAALQESLEIAQTLQLLQDIRAAQLSLGNTALALANRAKDRNNQQQAQTQRQIAAAFYQQAASNDAAPATQLKAQLNQLQLLVEMQSWEKIETLWTQAKEKIEQLSPSQLSIEARINLAKTLIKIGDKQPKLETIETTCLPSGLSNLSLDYSLKEVLMTAVKQAKNLQSQRLESYATGYLGRLYEVRHQCAIAQQFTLEALRIAQSIQAWDIAYQWEWQLGRLLNAQADKTGAIAAYKAAVESLKSVRKNLLAINSDVQFSFRDEVEPIYRQFVDLLLQPELGTSEPSQDNLKQAIQQVDALQLAEIENFLGCDLFQSVALGEVKAQKAALIYPIILPKRLAVIWQLPQQPLKYYETSIQKNDLEKFLQELQNYLSAPHLNDQVKIHAQILYKLIFEPLEATLKNNRDVETLVFVLDGALRTIPMAVLYDGKQYLMEKYPIALAPQLEIFAPQPLNKPLKVFVGGVGEKQRLNEINFIPIQYLVEEFNGIAKSVRTSQPLLNQKFTKENIQNQLKAGDFSAIHIKTHGLFSSDPEATYIVAYDQLIKGRDLAELIEMGKQGKPGTIELLVLSACNTARGDNRAVLGLAGIAVRAGARSTVSTLWTAQDLPNTLLMERFYQELSKPGMTRSKALNNAQNALFEQYKAANIWAAYVLVGNWL